MTIVYDTVEEFVSDLAATATELETLARLQAELEQLAVAPLAPVVHRHERRSRKVGRRFRAITRRKIEASEADQQIAEAMEAHR